MNGHRLDDIVCFEVGSSGTVPWTGSRGELDDDWQMLKLLAERGVVQITSRGSHVEIRGAKYVGLVVLPSGRRLVVRSKIPSLTLLEWMAYLGEFPRLTTWLPDAGIVVGDDWHECLARLFLYALEKVTRLHLRKDYVAVTRDEPAIRGRIVTTALAQRLHRLPSVPQLQRMRTFDTPYNIVLALALDRAPLLLAADRKNNWRRWGRLREQWGTITRKLDDPLATVSAAQWACPPGYRGALQLARLILIGASVDSASPMGGQAFTLSLAGLWERAVRRMCDELTPLTGWRRLGNEHRTRRWDDPVGHDDQQRWLTADVLLQRNEARWVLDAKYKCDFGNESRIDRFQMCAYAVAFDARRVSLVYPTGTSELFNERTLLTATIGGESIRIDSLCLSMSSGPESCRAALSHAASRTLRND